MSTQEERMSLKTDPLPVEIGTDKILSHIVFLEQEIQRHHEIVEQLQHEHEQMLQYAIELNIQEDDQYRLVRTEKPPAQKVNVKMMEEIYPAVLREIVENRAKEFDAKAKDLRDGKTAVVPSQSGAKVALKPYNAPLDEVLYRPGDPTISYQVVRKR